MSELKCSADGCSVVFKSDIPLSPNAKYTCREHTVKGPDKVRFQETQFDKEIDRKQ